MNVPSRDEVLAVWREITTSYVGCAAPGDRFLNLVTPNGSVGARAAYATPNVPGDTNSTCLMAQMGFLRLVLARYGLKFDWLDNAEDWRVWAPTVDLAEDLQAYRLVGIAPTEGCIYHVETKVGRHWRGVIGRSPGGYQTVDGGAKNASGHQCIVAASPQVQGLYDLTSGKPILDWIDVPTLVINALRKTTTAPVRPILRRGSRGEEVKRWQRILGVTVDGVFGPGTEQATRSWQVAAGLQGDGVVGPKTWSIAERKDTDPQAPAIHRVTEGVDLSHWNTSVNYHDPSWSWALVKAKQGVSKGPDDRFHEHCRALKEAGKQFGAYDYLEVRPGGPRAQDADLSASQFATLYRMAGCELPPAVDIELEGNGGRTSEEIIAAVLLWGKTVKGLIPEHRPLFYTFPSFIEGIHPEMQQHHELAEMFDLWIAHHGVAVPRVPKPWGDWVVHQYVGVKLDRDRSKIF